MTAKRGKILINFDPVLAHRVQRELFAQGFAFASNPQEYRLGEEMYGICFTQEIRTTTRNKKPVRTVTRLISWTSRPDVFRRYSVPLMSAELVLVERPVAQMV